MSIVSVIIPAFNCEKWLRETVDSVLGQTWSELELIIVDDGSTDQTLKIAETYKAANVKVLSQPNRGAASARNLGFRQCAGDFVMFLDSDDVVDSAKIAVQMERLASEPSGTIASCKWGRFYRTTEDVQFVPEQIWQDLSAYDWLIKAWNGGGMMVTGCWLVPRKIIERAGPWDETHRISPTDDAEFFTRVLLASSRVVFCEDSILYYRSGLASLSQQKSSSAAAAACLDAFLKMNQHLLAYSNRDDAKEAAAMNLTRFIYQWHPLFPDLLGLAQDHLKTLGGPTVHRLPRRFRRLALIIGFKPALFVRNILRLSLQKVRRSNVAI